MALAVIQHGVTKSNMAATKIEKMRPPNLAL